MKSKWFELKSKAILFRKQGKSIRNIEKNLSIPRSTLSGWFKNINLTESQKKRLEKKNNMGLVKAREIAKVWHNKQKEDRLKYAECEAEKTLSNIKDQTEITELALALLYLGEGFKKTSETGMGNTDPLILNFFLKILLNIYKVNIEKISFYLHLRADQNGNEMKKYWAKKLNVPIHRFKKVSIDKRTINSKTYPHYKGVCLINCGNVAIQRKLVYIGRKFCEKTIENMRD
ncbi:MAG: hypothetical protein WCK48_03130 [bacterium]